MDKFQFVLCVVMILRGNVTMINPETNEQQTRDPLSHTEESVWYLSLRQIFTDDFKYYYPQEYRDFLHGVEKRVNLL